MSGHDRLTRGLGAAATATGSLLVGVALAVVGARFGPLAMLALPVAVGALLLAYSRPLAAAGLVLATLPVGLQPVPGNPLGLQVVQVTVLGVTAMVVLRRLALGVSPLRTSRPLWWAVAFVAWALVCTGSAASTAVAIKQDANLVAAVVLAMLVVTVAEDLRGVRLLAWTFLAAGTVMTLPPLRDAGSISSAYGGAVVENRLQGTFAQPNELGAFAMLVVLVGIGVVLGARSRRERTLAWCALLPALAALALSLSRGAWIGTTLGGVALLVMLPSARRMLLTVGVPVVLCAAALGAFAPESPQVQVVGDRVATLRDPGGNPYDDRPRIWAEGRREVRDDPLTGQGPGAFPLVSTRSVSGAQTVQAEHSHSLLLTVAAETGLPGAALVVALAIALAFHVRDALRVLDAADAAVLAGAFGAVVAVAGQGLIDFTQRNAVLLMSDWALVGVVAAGAAAARRAQVRASSRILAGPVGAKGP